METIKIATFSRTPGGRTPDDGPGNGQDFRDKFLVPALRRGSVIVELDQVAGLPVSFLEEAFGGLVREAGFTAEQLRKKLRLTALNPRFQRRIPQIWTYIAQQDARRHSLAGAA